MKAGYPLQWTTSCHSPTNATAASGMRTYRQNASRRERRLLRSRERLSIARAPSQTATGLRPTTLDGARCLLPSGLYRRLRPHTGSATTGSRAWQRPCHTADWELTRLRVSPCPEGCSILCILSLLYALPRILSRRGRRASKNGSVSPSRSAARATSFCILRPIS